MKSIKPSLQLWVMISLLIVIIVILYFCGINYLFNADYTSMGQFGDSFGSINAVFTGLAFSGVIVTILMQRAELIKQGERQISLEAEDRKQRFEKSIFMLIKLHLDIIDKLELLSKRKRDVFRAYIESICSVSKPLQAFSVLKKLSDTELASLSTLSKDQVESNFSVNGDILGQIDIDVLKELVAEKELKTINTFHSSDIDSHVSILQDALKKSARKHRNILGHYFRNLYNILRIIDGASFLNSNEKKELVKLVRTQLSNDELLAIFYNSIVEVNGGGEGYVELGFPKMTHLIGKYNLVKHLGLGSYLHRLHLDIFNQSKLKASSKVNGK